MPRRHRWRPSPLITASLALHAAALGVALVPGGWPAALAAAVADHLVLLGCSVTPRSRLLGPNTVAVDGDSGTVALTLDDGPDPDVTPRVLDLLEARGHRATLFPIGVRAERSAPIVARAAAAGHGIGNHTWSHPSSFAFRGPRGLALEIDRAQEVLAGITGRRPRLFRPPAGMRNPFLDPILGRRGLRLVSWTRRGYDAVDTDHERIVRRLTRRIRAGDILVLHDGGRGAEGTLTVLPAVLDALASHGLRSAPIPEPEREEG